MKKASRMALWGAAVFALAASAEAQNYVNGDLLLGFTGGANDYIYDLGQFSSLSSGETWSVGANQGSQYGVVGAQSTGHHIYATSFDTGENAFLPLGLYANARGNVATISGQPTAIVAGGYRAPTPADTTGWTFQTAQPPGTPGNTFQNNFFNPNVGASGVAYFFDNNTTSGGVTPAGQFTYNANSGVLTFTAVPEPGTFALISGALVVLVIARRSRLQS